MTQLRGGGEPGAESLDDAYLEEREKLATVIEAIKASAIEADSHMPARAAYKEAAKSIQKSLQARKDTFESALEQPYFGRVDYLEHDTQRPRDIYIGQVNVPGTNVHAWVAPVARLYYTNENSYSAPSGEIRVRVDLKRYLRIRKGQLVELNDTYRRALPGASSRKAAAPSDALVAALSGVGASDGQLQVIVETIEPDQYEAIANVADKVLVVQGAAGSGKSEIGFHRIAYLLSPFNEVSPRERPTTQTTLLVGPSRSFREYVSDILPRLGVREGVVQVVLREWLNNHQSRRLNIRPRIWNNLLDRGAITKFNEEAERFKSSMSMVDVLDRHTKNLLREYRNSVKRLPALTIRLDARSTVVIQKEDVDSALTAALSGADENPRLNSRRQDFLNRIANRVPAASRPEGRMRGTEAERRRIEVELVNPWLNPHWPWLDFRQEYAMLLSDPEKMVELSRGGISRENAEAIQASSARALTDGFEDSDQGALTYLDHLLNDIIPRHYRHIIVDEAQDISPIEFRLLGLNSVNNSFTILGDVSQRLTPHRGISRWRDLERVLGRSDIKVQHARTSYRSNQHITRFNNRILRLFDTNIGAPIPFGREGHRVEYHQHRIIPDMYQGITRQMRRIRALDDMADARIAVLVRDMLNLNRFQEFCTDNRVEEMTRFGQETSESMTILARIPDVKGLEYDAVIVLGVNESFASTTFNQKLLYSAATRAKHYLAIHWSGQQSPILQEIYSGGVVSFN